MFIFSISNHENWVNTRSKTQVLLFAIAFLFNGSSRANAQNCNNNGLDDACDIACGVVGGECDLPGCGLSQDCNENGVPDECDFTTAFREKFGASDPGAQAYFGYSVAVDGDTAVVGSCWDDDNGLRSGSAYIFQFRFGEWIETAKLTPDDAAADDWFGYSVAIDGRTVVVGSFRDSDAGSQSGSAYIFRELAGTWEQVVKLTASDAASGDQFGYSVAIDLPRVVVGANRVDDGAVDQGAAYVFFEQVGNWLSVGKLTANDAALSDDFGSAVAISDTKIVVGAARHDQSGTDRGAVYVYGIVDFVWQQIGKITASDAADQDQFGYSLSVDGDWLAVGAPGVSGAAGAAYLFTRTNDIWLEDVKLTADDVAAGDNFGRSVDIDGQTVLVGSYLNGDGGPASGAAYAFRSVGGVWQQHDKLVAPDAAIGDFFGHSVSLSGNVALVTAYWDDDGGVDSGSTYFFTLASCDCNGNGIPDECEVDCNDNLVPDDCDIALETSVDCNVNGVPDECDISDVLVEKILASDGIGDDWFGFDVAMSGNTAVVSATGRDDGVINSGSAYVYQRTNGVWREVAKLSADDAATNDQFGSGLSIDGNTLVVGARFDDDDANSSGSAYIFREIGGVWQQLAKLTASDPQPGAQFGHTTSLWGDTVAIGAPFGGESGSGTGAVYIFRENMGGWSQVAKLIASDAVANDEFGYDVAMVGDTLVVGARGDDHETGAVYVFKELNGNWGEIAKITASDAAEDDFFGQTLAYDGATLCVGAPRADEGEQESGAAYVFREVNGIWTQLAVLKSDQTWREDFFGTSIAVDGNLILVGSPQDDTTGTNSGSVTAFREVAGRWLQLSRITAVDAEAGDQFGSGIAISGNCALIGARTDDNLGYSTKGAGYLFEIPTSLDCNENGTPDDCETDCNANGVVDDCELETILTSKLLGQDVAAGDRYGWSVAVYGDTAVIGSYQDGDGGENSGSAYVFSQVAGNWLQVAKLTASDTNSLNRFGYSVAIHGDIIVVASNPPTPRIASLYLFRKVESGWQEIAKISADDGSRFGERIVFDGHTILAGAPDNAGMGIVSGAVFVFRQVEDVWQQVQVLYADDAASGDEFGFSVALYGDTAIIGARRNDEVFPESGSAYIFSNVGGVWQQTAHLTSDDPALGDNFGFEVAIGNGVAAVANSKGTSAPNSVIVFEQSEGVWQQVTELVASDARNGDRFGYRISIDNNLMLVGSQRSFTGAVNAGAAYLFEYEGGIWNQIARISAFDAVGNDLFGCSVSLDGNIAVIGAYMGDDGGFESGTAYVLDLSDLTDCNNNAVPDECDLDTNGDGIPDDCNGPCGNEQVGDLNGSGTVELGDLVDFSAVVLEPNSYPPGVLCVADINLDSAVDGNDIQGFVDLLIGQ